jgi:hemerythrin superfamily protein
MPARTAASAKTTDALALLKKDHANALKLLRKLESSEDAAEREDLLAEVAQEIEVHAQIEEEIFYPAFHRAAEEAEDEKLFYEAAEEHGLVHIELPKLQQADPGSDVFAARAKVLKDLIELHAEEEEHELFPRVRKLLDRSERIELGHRLQARKSALMNGGSARRS